MKSKACVYATYYLVSTGHVGASSAATTGCITTASTSIVGKGHHNPSSVVGWHGMYRAVVDTGVQRARVTPQINTRFMLALRTGPYNQREIEWYLFYRSFIDD